MSVELQIAESVTGIEAQLVEFADILQVIKEKLPSEVRLRREVCVRLVDELESQQLNEQYRGKAKPTNVLSFPCDVFEPQWLEPSQAQRPAMESLPLGDLLICWPQVLNEAQAQGKSAQAHLSHLFVHGVLHLLGFDHEEAQQAEQMEQLEIDILTQLGIPNPYQT